MRAKTTRAFRTISEAGEELGLQPHVLRFWESKFADIKPIKRGGGRRFYRPEDIEFIRGIKTLLYDEKHPIKDVQKLIAKSGASRIVELGRSVETASREKDIKDTTLVPDRIEVAARAETSNSDDAEPDNAESKEATPAPAPEETLNADVETTSEDASPPPDEAPTEPQDLSGLESALERLQSLRKQWDEFEKSRPAD
jgi:DNA-binding transcriptional MerR regulator